MGNVNTASFIGDSVKLVRNILASGITDPISSSRDSSSKFVNTSIPTRVVNYPLITIYQVGMIDKGRMGMSSQIMMFDTRLQIDVWAKDTRMRDILAGSVLNVLRTNQLGITSNISGTVTEGLYHFRLFSMLDRNEETTDREQIKRKIIDVGYDYITV